MKTLPFEKIIFMIGSVIIMFGMVMVVSSTTIFGSYALWYVGQNIPNRILAPQQILLLVGTGILVSGLYVVIKSKFTLSSKS